MARNAGKTTKESSMEFQQLLSDLQQWEQSIKEKDKLLKAHSQERKLQERSNLPPVRESVQNLSNQPSLAQMEENFEFNKRRKQSSAASHTYDHFCNKWDKFDVEAALIQVDKEDTKEVSEENVKHPPKSSDINKINVLGKSDNKQNRFSDISASNYLGSSGKIHTSSSIFGGHQDTASEALSEKEQGNEYFKEKRYSEAIDCYTRSILIYPTAVVFANRAMAYIKIGRYQEADYDCSEAINLDDRYVKAYSRRGMARREMGMLVDAIEDFEFALRLEPNNKELKKQYEETRKAFLKKASKQVLDRNAAGKQVSEKKASVLVEEVKRETSLMATEKAENMKSSKEEVATLLETQITSSDLATSDTSPHVSIHEKNVEAKMQKIDNSAKNQTSVVSTQTVAERAASLVTTAVAKKITAPKTAYEFEALWKGLHGDMTSRIQVLKVMDPTSLPKVFKDALSAPLLLDIIKCVEHTFLENPTLGIQYLENLPKVARFDMTIMCLSSKDRTELHKCWDRISSNNNAPACLQEALKALRLKYCR